MTSRSEPLLCYIFFFFNDTATTEIYTLSLHDALPIFVASMRVSCAVCPCRPLAPQSGQSSRAAVTAVSPLTISSLMRSEEHTSELQSPCNLVCRLLLEKKKRATLDEALQPRVQLGRDP